MKLLILIILLTLSGCAGHTLAFVYQYDSPQAVKVETSAANAGNNIGTAEGSWRVLGY